MTHPKSVPLLSTTKKMKAHPALEAHRKSYHLPSGDCEPQTAGRRLEEGVAPHRFGSRETVVSRSQGSSSAYSIREKRFWRGQKILNRYTMAAALSVN